MPKQQTVKLTPCPFCGSPDRDAQPQVAQISPLEYRVRCGDLRCNAFGPSRDTAETAASAWNQAKEREFRCPGCGAMWAMSGVIENGRRVCSVCGWER